MNGRNFFDCGLIGNMTNKASRELATNLVDRSCSDIPNNASLTSLGGPIPPIYVHGLFAAIESEWDSKEGNLNFSRLSTAVDVDGDAEDKAHCARKQNGSPFFAANFHKAIKTKNNDNKFYDFKS